MLPDGGCIVSAKASDGGSISRIAPDGTWSRGSVPVVIRTLAVSPDQRWVYFTRPGAPGAIQRVDLGSLI